MTNDSGTNIPTPVYPDIPIDVNDIEVNIVKLPTYADIALPIFRMGYAALPASSIASKAPTVKYAWLSKENPDAARVRRETAGWANGAIDGVACWLLHSHQSTVTPHLDVIDVDDLADLPWALATFGPSPLVQLSGRDGGGCHIFYRRDPSRDPLEYGSRTHIGGHKVDHKTGPNGYVVAPGSIHKSGRFYRLQLNGEDIVFSDLTPEILWSLPILDRTILDAVVAEGRGQTQDLPLEDAGEVDPLYAELGLSPLPRGYSGKGGQSKSGLQRVQADPDAVTMRWGGTITAYAAGLADGSHRSACPHDDHKSDQGGGASYILSVSGGKAVSATCFACDSVYVYREAFQPFLLKRDTKKVGTLLEPTEDHWLDTVDLNFIVLHSTDLIDGKFIPHKDYAPGRSLALRAPQGAGKTELMRFYVDEQRAEKADSVIQAFSHLVNLSKAQAKRLDLPHYQDTKEKISGSTACVVNSGHRIERISYGEDFEVTNHCPDLVFLDESEQVLRALASGTMNSVEAVQAKNSLDFALANAKRVIVADADYSEFTRCYVNALRPHDPLFLVDVVVDVPWRYQLVLGKNELEATLLEEWEAGKRIYVPTFLSPDTTLALAERMRTIRPTAKIAVISQKTQHDYDLATINDWVGDYDAILCTPTMGTGVSIDIRDHFDCIIGFFENGVGIAQDSRQILHRVRYPKEDVIRFFAPSYGVFRETHPQKILQAIVKKEEVTAKHLDRMGFLSESEGMVTQDLFICEVTTEGIKTTYRSDVMGYMKQYANIVSHSRKNGQDCLASAIQEYFSKIPTMHKFEVIDPTPLEPAAKKKQAELRKASKKTVVDAYVAEVVNARKVDPAQIPYLQNSTSKNDQRAYTRAVISQFYGRADIKTVTFDDDGKGRTKARKFAHMLLVREKQDTALAAKDARAHHAGVIPTHAKHVYYEGMTLYLILRWFGLDKLDEHVLTETDLALGTEKVLEKAALLDLFGITIPANLTEKPIQFLQNVCKRMGLMLASNRRHNGKREYSLSEDSVTDMMQHSESYREALLAKVDQIVPEQTAEKTGGSKTKSPPVTPIYIEDPSEYFSLTLAQEQDLLEDLLAI